MMLADAFATHLVWLAVCLPLGLALLYGWPAARGWVARLAPWAVLPSLALAFVGPATQWAEPWLLLGSRWGLTELTQPFLGVTAAVWLWAGLYALGYVQITPANQRFYLFWLLTLAGNVLLILAQDVPSFYTGFGLMTFAAYGLIVQAQTDEARRAGKVYLIMAVVGEGLLLAGFILACRVAGDLWLASLPAALAQADDRHLIMSLLWLGFGIKAGLPLLHLWLPLAHPVAPTPASAVLSGTMIKAGLLGWLLTLPLGQMALSGWGNLIILTGLLGAFGGAVIGVCQRSPKAVLAYSSISQMGLMVVLVGAACILPQQWPALLAAIALYAVHHGLAKGALFLGVGVAQTMGARHPLWVWLGLGWPALALAGLPFSSGAFAKTAMKAGLHGEASAVPTWWDWLPLLLSLGAVGTGLLMARFLWLLRIEFGDKAVAAWLPVGWGLAVLASILGIFLLPLLPDTPLQWQTAPAKVAAAGWPVLVAAVLGYWAIRSRRRMPLLPPGDLLVWVQAGGRRGQPILERWGRVIAGFEQGFAKRLSVTRQSVFLAASKANRLEIGWMREGALVGAGLLVLMTALLLFRSGP